MNMDFKRKLPIPKQIKEDFPISAEMEKVKAARDEEIKAVFRGESDKFILVIGPCSADAREPVLEYISRLRRVQDAVADRILIIPRIYTNKPRTTGEGYKGMLHQPDPEQASDMLRGIIAIRDLHFAALRDYGFSCADEMLYPENHRYLSDLLSYVAIGARSVEDQQHRLTASGLDIPVGMKNPTEGDLSTAAGRWKAKATPTPTPSCAGIPTSPARRSPITITRIWSVSPKLTPPRGSNIPPRSSIPTTPIPAKSTSSRSGSPRTWSTAAVQTAICGAWSRV